MKRKRLKSLPKIPRPHVPRRLKRRSREERVAEAISSIPRITNETVAEHREKVLGSARKYIYPLEHSKHRIIVISVTLLVIAVVVFFSYCGLALYKFQSTSSFLYRVTQVVPFPVAKAGSSYVAYENYLFELRRYIHYYQTQQRVDFSGKAGKQQLDAYKPQALEQVVDATYVKQLADQYHVSVSNREVSDELDLLRVQNQLNANSSEIADVAHEFFGWSISDLKRELKQELLAQKVASKLDTSTHNRAETALSRLHGGADFGQLAAEVSDDATTKGNGGQYADTAITVSSTTVPPQVVQALAHMQVGQVSGIIDTGNTLEIVKLLANNGGKYQAAHISFRLQSIDTYLAPLKKQHPPHVYISVKLP